MSHMVRSSCLGHYACGYEASVRTRHARHTDSVRVSADAAAAARPAHARGYPSGMGRPAGTFELLRASTSTRAPHARLSDRDRRARGPRGRDVALARAARAAHDRLRLLDRRGRRDGRRQARPRDPRGPGRRSCRSTSSSCRRTTPSRSRRAEHVAALFVFLGLSVLISLLYARAVDRADAAEANEHELRALQELSRDLVVRGPGEETLSGAPRRCGRAVRLRGRGAVRERPGRGPGGTGGRGRRDGHDLTVVEPCGSGAGTRAAAAVGGRPDARADRVDGGTPDAGRRRGARAAGRLRPARARAGARPAPGGGDQRRDPDPDGDRAAQHARRGLARPPEPAGCDQGLGDRPAGPRCRALERGSRGRAAHRRSRNGSSRRARREPARHVADRSGRAAGPAGVGRSGRGRRRQRWTPRPCGGPT